MKFPKGFLIGGAFSAAQCEGACREGGRGLSVWDMIPFDEGNTGSKFSLSYEEVMHAFHDDNDTRYPKRRGIDFYHHYKEDLNLFAEMGFKACRISISWSRLFPTGEESTPNESGLKFYHDVFQHMRYLHIEPIVTISHFDLPAHLAIAYNGWESRKLIDYFQTYTTCLFDEFHKDVTYWITFNEIDATIHIPYIGAGMIARDDTNDETKKYQALHHQFVAASKTIQYGHDHYPNIKIGCMATKNLKYASTCKPEDCLQFLKETMEDMTYSDVQVFGEYPFHLKKYWKDHNIQIAIENEDLNTIKENTVDFVSFSYYASLVTSFDKSNKESTSGNLLDGEKNPYLKQTPWGWQIDPIGLRYSLNQLYDRYHLPLFVAENGLGMIDEFKDDTVYDDYRIDYVKQHLEQLLIAIEEDGVDCIGYTYWGCIDCIAGSTSQMKKRYGFIYVDQNDDGTGTLQRYPKQSFYWYKNLIKANGFSS